MKTKLFFTLTGLFFFLYGSAYTTLHVQDPQQAWKKYQGTIDSAVISIKPKGAYFEYGLYLTFSSRPHVNNYDTFEVQLFFDLPEEAIVTDSWLWVGNQIVQAMITDRGRANMIYESIVQRRQDPSILYKNSNTQYELRIFPQPANDTRKVKITYLLPATWGPNHVSAPLPFNILKASSSTPHVRVLSYTDSVWQSPRIVENGAITFQPVSGAGYSHEAVISTAYVNNTTIMTYSMASPMQNGIFAAKYETGPTDGYYQVVVLPSKLVNMSTPKKAALLFDYEPGLSTTTPNDVLYQAKQMLLQYYSPTDSFNLFFSTALSVYKPSNVWLPCDTGTIEYTFSHLAGGNPISSVTNVPALLGSGIDFVKANGANGSMVMITNSDNYHTPTAANAIIAAVQSQMSPYNFPINTLSYTTKGYSYYYNSGLYYQANEYLFSNLASLTGGVYKEALLTNSTGTNSLPFATAMNNLFSNIDGTISTFEINADLDSGFCYGNYSSLKSQTAAISTPVIQVGKYHGIPPLEIEISGLYKSNLFWQSTVINDYYDADSATRKIWMGHYLKVMENSNPDNMTKLGIIDSSIRSRVLSRYTAFLALEPSDTVSACLDCEDETNTGGGGVTDLSTVGADSISIAAMPNPFVDMVTFKIKLKESSRQVNLKIYNLMGQLVTHYSPAAGTTEFTYEWNANDLNGEKTLPGIYIAVLETDSERQTLKLMKR